MFKENLIITIKVVDNSGEEHLFKGAIDDIDFFHEGCTGRIYSRTDSMGIASFTNPISITKIRLNK